MLRFYGVVAAIVAVILTGVGYRRTFMIAPNATIAGFMITQEDIVRNGARLSAADRETATTSCTAAAMNSPMLTVVKGQVVLVPIKEISTTIYTERANKVCVCVIDALEDRTNAVEFKIAMATMARKPITTWLKTAYDHADYKSAAIRLGISDRDYGRHIEEVRDAFRSTVTFCAEREAARHQGN